jgi:cytochrome c556
MHPIHNASRRCRLSLFAILAACSPAMAPPADRAAEPMPRIAGIVLEPRMQRHADELADLRAAVSTVDFPRATAAARAILAEPRLARPSPQAGQTLNDELPSRFFALQDRMIEATREVEAAAGARDREALDDAFDSLASTCRSCHALYRADPSLR